MKRILDQLARSGLLWDDDMIAAILSDNPPPMEELVLALVIGAMDAEAVLKVIRRAPGTSGVSQDSVWPLHF
jgi:hypothetical protein